MITFADGMNPLRHKFICRALLLLGIYVLHFFLLDSILSSSATTHVLKVATDQTSGQIHHPHHHRHSGLAFLRMLEKHEGAKQQISVPVADMYRPLSCIVLFISEVPVTVACSQEAAPLSPSSYRLYLQDRVFRI